MLLGADHTGYNLDRHAAHPTAVGRSWGLDDWWVGGSGIAPGDVSVVLATDELGAAAAWALHYGGAPGSGFVFVWGVERPVPPSLLPALYRVAEYGIGTSAEPVTPTD
jgi:hypothetical protein